MAVFVKFARSVPDNSAKSDGKDKFSKKPFSREQLYVIINSLYDIRQVTNNFDHLGGLK